MYDFHLIISPSAKSPMGPLLRNNFLDPSIPDSIGGIQGRKGRIKQTLTEQGLGKYSPPSTPGISNPLLFAQQDVMYSDDTIAVIGMACSFPGAASVEEFWDIGMLRRG